MKTCDFNFFDLSIVFKMENYVEIALVVNYGPLKIKAINWDFC